MYAAVILNFLGLILRTFFSNLKEIIRRAKFYTSLNGLNIRPRGYFRIWILIYLHNLQNIKTVSLKPVKQ